MILVYLEVEKVRPYSRSPGDNAGRLGKGDAAIEHARPGVGVGIAEGPHVEIRFFGICIYL